MEMCELKQYVLVHATPIARGEQPVLLVERVKEDWQKGRLNLPGGGIERMESPESAAIRELREETGLIVQPADVKLVGRLDCDGCVVHVCNCLYRADQEPHQLEDQPIYQLNWADARDHQGLIPNLKIIIPLCRSRVSGWVMQATASEHRWHLDFVGAQACLN